MAANKRIRSRRTARTGSELAREPQRTGPKVISTRKKDLDREIHRLECYLAEAPAKMRQHRMSTRDILPPMEVESPVRTKGRNQRVPLQQRRVQQRRVTLLFLELAVVATGIVAVSTWLNQWFKLW